MKFELRDLLYIVGLVATAIITFLSTRYKLKEYVRDKYDNLQAQITDLNSKLQEQKSKDDLQQQVIDQIAKQIDGLIPMLIDKIQRKKKHHE